MLPSSSLAARRPGRRLLTPDIREYQAVAATYAKLPPGVSSGSLIHIARQAAVIMGLPPTAIVVLDALWSYTQPIDWLAPSRPLVWPSNETLRNKLNLKERTLQTHLFHLRALGFIAAKDGPRGYRHGRRAGGLKGPIIADKTFGFDLSLLALRHGEFVELIATDRLEKAARLEHVQQCREIRNDIEDAFALVRSCARWTDPWSTLEAECTPLFAEIRNKDITPLEAAYLARTLDACGERAKIQLNHDLANVMDSPWDGASCTLNTPTTSLPDVKKEDGQAMGTIFADRDQDQLTNGSHSGPRLSLMTAQAIIEIAPQLGAFCSGPPTAGNLNDAADRVRALYGIPARTWHDAYHAMGRSHHARLVALATMLAWPRTHFADPAGYFGSLVARARDGTMTWPDTPQRLAALKRRSKLRCVEAALAEIGLAPDQIADKKLAELELAAVAHDRRAQFARLVTQTVRGARRITDLAGASADDRFIPGLTTKRLPLAPDPDGSADGVID